MGHYTGRARATRLSNVLTEQRTKTIERIGTLIEPQANGCWIYNANPNSYGQPSEHGQTRRVHRYVYEILVGPIPADHDLHHTCETKGCCNPAHLTPLTRGDHMSEHQRLRRVS